MDIRERSELDDSIRARPIGAKWGVDGVTKINAALTKSIIRVRFTNEAVAGPIMLTMQHERGHAALAADVADGEYENKLPFDVLRGYDKWQNEIEAWVRGCGEFGSYEDGMMILDCLNTYRRNLSVSDEEWIAGREVILDCLINPTYHTALRQYEPLEPARNDEGYWPEPPECVEVVDDDDDELPDDPEPDDFDPDDYDRMPDQPEPEPDPDPDDRGDAEPGDDDGDDDGDEDEDDDWPDDDDDDDGGDEPWSEGSPNAPDIDLLPPAMDRAWDTQEILDAVMAGETLESVQARTGLDPEQAPPLLRAISIRNGG
jgi:hypothetical protein